MMIVLHAPRLTILAVPRSVRACEIGTGRVFFKRNVFFKRKTERAFGVSTAWPSFRGDAEHRTSDVQLRI
jgi:hypothetical protein